MLDNIVLQGPVGPEVLVGDKKYLYFGGADYLGMASREQVLTGARAALDRYGVSSAASRVSSGTNALHLELEAALASYAGTEAAVIFAAGYLAMRVLVEGVVRSSDRVLIQANAHSSIHEAVSLSGLPTATFRLDDLDTLRQALRDSTAGDGRFLVLGEGVSPLMGTIFPLPEVLECLREVEALVLLDDAHAFGVLGASGRGTADYWGLGQKSDPVHGCATLSKAFGSFGGCVTGSAGMIADTRERSMVYVCSTPPPAPVLGAALAAVRLAAERPQLRQRLWQNVAYLKQGLRDLGLPADETPAPVAPICLADGGKLRQVNAGLQADGILAPFMTYPGSPAAGMIRVAVTALHSEEQIQRLLESLSRHL